MHRKGAFVWTLLLAAASLTALAPRARAQDEPRKESPGRESKDEDEFETGYIGLKAGIWYQPALSLHGMVGGLQGPAALAIPANTPFDVHDDLGVKTNSPKPTYLDVAGCPLDLEAFVDTRWVSLSAWWITPFQYKGTSTLTRTFDFAGVSFGVSRPVETSIAQSMLGFDIKFNILNNRFVRLSPLIGLDSIALDWSVKDVTPGSPFKASTEDIDFPLTFGRYKVLPYPVVGGEIRAGYRDYIEVDAKLQGIYINYLGVQAWTALVDLGVTGYLPFWNHIGVRLGYRYYYFQAKTVDQQPKDQFEADMKISGATLALIARF